MIAPIFLIDFENVQPKALERLKPGTAQIKVFLGQNQSKLMLDLVRALQPFGSDAEYIQIQGSGPDAVDFHIAFYIGRLHGAVPGASFTIISKDKGFDPLVKHLTLLGIECRRLAEIPEPPAPVESKPIPKPVAKAVTKAAAPPTTARARAKFVEGVLRKSTKPTRLTTLRTSIKALFKPALDDKSVDAVVQSMLDSRKIVVTGTIVTYALG